MTPDEFIKGYTRGCSNVIQGYDDMQTPVIDYHPWLTQEQALRAVELAREEMIDKAYKYINYQLNLPNDFEQHFRKAMEE